MLNLEGGHKSALQDGSLRITVVHQGFELYGSDRSFIRTVSAIRHKFKNAHIRVIIPELGPIYPHLLEMDCNIEIRDLLILRRSDLRSRSLFGIPRIMRLLRNALEEIEASDITYVNTSVVLDFLIAARFSTKLVIGHVHEIPTGLAMFGIRLLLRFSRCSLIFNSVTTSHAFDMDSRNSHVLLNACDDAKNATTITYDGNRPLRLLLIGRINSWKGQDLLIEAVARIPKNIVSSLETRIVGSAFRGTDYEQRAATLIDRRGLKDYIALLPFTENTEDIYNWADVVVVPSRKPEPFGLVAIEAMAYGRPVIAAAHGGLTEIVSNNENGWLFTPNAAEELSETIVNVIGRPDLVSKFGEAAKRRFETDFSSQSYADKLEAILLAEVRGNRTG